MVGRHCQEKGITVSRQFGKGSSRNRRSGVARCGLEQDLVGFGADCGQLFCNGMREGFASDDDWRFEHFAGDALNGRLQERGGARQGKQLLGSLVAGERP